MTELINCCDGCGRSVAEDEVLHRGWTYLEVQKRYRCPSCWRELHAVNALAVRCKACNEVGMLHCHDPLHCGGPWTEADGGVLEGTNRTTSGAIGQP